MRAPSQERKKDRLELMLIWFIVGLSVLLVVIMVAACNPVHTTQSEAPEVDPFATGMTDEDLEDAANPEFVRLYNQVSEAVQGTILEKCVPGYKYRFLYQKPIYKGDNDESKVSGDIEMARRTPEEEAYFLLRMCGIDARDSIQENLVYGVPMPYFAQVYVGEYLELPEAVYIDLGFEQCEEAGFEGYVTCLLGRLDDFERDGAERYAAAHIERWNVWNAKWATPPEGDLAVLMDKLRPLMDDEVMVRRAVCYGDSQTQDAALRLRVNQIVDAQPDVEPGAAANHWHQKYFGYDKFLPPGYAICARSA